MTTEDDFNAMLDANPDDHTTRLVFADWLEERGDPRGEGYRALGVCKIVPRQWGTNIWAYLSGSLHLPGNSWLPHDWYFSRFAPCAIRDRREAEDAAAIAFAKLPADRRAELLATAPASAAG